MVSDDTVPTRGEKQKILATWFNVMKDALSGSFLPRNLSGVVADEGGSLGTDAYRFLKAKVKSGHWVPGDVKVIHPYNGDVLPGEGWMLMDGRTIGQAAYDTEHGAGHWATYVGTSILDGKRLPSMVGRYAVGKATTPQTGSGAITPVGNAGNVTDLHHAHNFINGIDAATQSDIVSDANGDNNVTINAAGTAKNLGVYTLSIKAGSLRLSISGGDIAGSTSEELSSTESIQPDSMEACFYMRVV